MTTYFDIARTEEVRNLNVLAKNLTLSTVHYNLDTPQDAVNIKKQIEDKVAAMNLVEDPIANVYTSVNGTFDRLTKYVANVFKTVTYKNREEERARAYAEKDFTSRNIPLDSVLVLSTTEQYTLDQRVIYYDRLFNEAAAKGRILHKYIEKALTEDETRRAAIDTEIAKEAEAVSDKDGNEIKPAINLNSFRWLNKKIKFIIDQAGLVVNLDDEVYNPDLVDTVYPEIMAYSELLKVATKIDGLVQHADGTLSILDWKTGRLFSDETSGYMMKYGTAFGLNDSKINRAKLEVVLRMMMVKEMIPEAKFRNLNINWLNYSTDLSVIPIDLQPYLNTIKEGLKVTNPQAYQTLESKGAFAEGYYRAPNIKVEDWKLKNNKLSPQEQVAQIDLELRSVRARYTDADLENRPEIKSKIADLAILRLQIESGSDTPIDVQEKNDLTDMTAIQRWTLNIKDAPSKFLQQFSKILEKRRFKFNKNFDEFQEEKEKYLLPVLKEYLEKNSMASALSFLTRNKINHIPILGGLDKKDLYSFMWRYYETDTMKGWYANTKNTYFDTKSGIEVELTETQKQFRDWYHRVKNETYERVVNTVVEDRNGKSSTIARVQGIDPVLYEEFMPRTKASDNELLEREKLSGIPSKL